MNKFINKRSHKNIFRKLDLVSDENIEEGNDNILTNIAIIEEILQRTNKVKSNNLETSYRNNNIEKIQNCQNNNTKLKEKTNMAKFFIGDEDDYQMIGEESTTRINNNFLNDFNYTLPIQYYSQNIFSKSVLDVTNIIEKKPSYFRTHYSLSEINITSSFYEKPENNINILLLNTNSNNIEKEKFNNNQTTINVNFKKSENLLQHVLQSSMKDNKVSKEEREEFYGLKKSHSHLSLKSLVSTL